MTTDRLTDNELAEIRTSAEWAISANNAVRLLAEVDRLRAEADRAHERTAEMMRRPGELAIQLAEIGGMVGYPDPSGIVDAVQCELSRLRAENTALAEALKAVAAAVTVSQAEQRVLDTVHALVADALGGDQDGGDRR